MAIIKMIQRTTITLLYLVFAAPSLAATEQFTGLVTAVADGNTISVLTAQNKQQVKIRLYGIDCPESRRAFGNRAKQATSEAVFGKNITVQPIDTDPNGLTAAVVLMPIGKKSLNEHLVREGLASVNTKYCTQEDICEPLRRLEKAAKSQKRGMWEDKTPVSSEGWQFIPGGSGGSPGD